MTMVLTIVFFFALFCTMYFLSRLLTWHAWKISPQNFKKGISNKAILECNIIGILSVILWSIVFYFNQLN